MSIARKFVLMLAAALIAGCGGGSPEPEAFSPQVMKAAAPQVATSVTSAAAAELLMDTAETAYHSLFPAHKTTQTSGPFAYRYYPETGMYLGVVVTGNAGYVLDGVYLVGGGYGTLASPFYVGPLTNYVNVTIDPGITYKTLSIAVNVAGYGSYSTQVGSVPVPVTQVDFCGRLTTDPNLQAVLKTYGASFSLTGCSFTGTSGSFSGTVTVPQYGSVAFSVTYSYV
jgi:hypothetical protein